MSSVPVKDGVEPADALRTACLTLGPLLVIFFLMLPRAVEPMEVPGLVLPEGAVRAVRAERRRLAAAIPDDAETMALVDGFIAYGRGERVAEAPHVAARRNRELQDGFARYVTARGDAAARRVRARLVMMGSRAFEGAGCGAWSSFVRAECAERADPAAGAPFVGGYSRVLEHYGAVRGDRLVAPRIVLEALLMVRVNAAFGRPLEEGLTSIEKLAFHGWRALETQDADLASRLHAVRTYAALGGERADEAMGSLLYRGGRYGEASIAFERAYHRTGSVRLRNYMIAATERSIE